MDDKITAGQITEAAEAFAAEINSHPECDRDQRDEALWNAIPRQHVVFALGRRPDIDIGEDLHSPPPPPRSPEKRLLDYLTAATAPIKMLNPVSRSRKVGKGPGTIAASFGITLNPELGFK